jgi:hypothetical protein
MDLDSLTIFAGDFLYDLGSLMHKIDETFLF